MPSQRFRDEKGAIAGQDRDGSKNLREGLKEYFAEYGFDPSVTGSTRGFGRDLLSWEQDLVKLKNRGKHPDRAGKRALDEETREKNDQKLLEKIEKGRKNLKADAAMAGWAPRKRRRNDEDGDVQNSKPAPETENPGSHSREVRGTQVSLQPPRYGTHGAPSNLYQNPNFLDVGDRSSHGIIGAVHSPFQNASTLGGNRQAPSLVNSQNLGRPSTSFYPGIGLRNDIRLDYLPQGLTGQTWSTQPPVHSAHYPMGQYHQQHSRMEGTFPAVPVAPQTAQQAHLPQGTRDAPVHEFDRFKEDSVQSAQPRRIGKRDRPQAESGPPENSLGPGGKRRRMPGTEGHNLPPGTQRRAEKKLLKSKRDEHLPPPVLNIDESGRYTNQAHQVAITVEDAETMPIASQVPYVAIAQQPSVPRTASAAAHIPAPDIRDMPPTTEWECEGLQGALSYTRWAFAQWTGMNAPETNRFESYNVQFKVLFDEFHRWWHSRSNPERLQPVEWLVQVDAWEGTVGDWKPPTDDGLLFECVRRGFYAPRNGDGSLQ